MQRIAQHLAHRARAGKQVFFFKQFECGNCSRATHRMAGIGVAMEKLHRMVGCVGVRLHHGVINPVGANHAAQGKHTIGDAFGKVQHVRLHAVEIRAKVGAHAAKAGNNLVKNQQNAVLVANFPQPF